MPVLAKAERRFRCQACLFLVLEEDILRAVNPFDPDDVITGCPKCKTAEMLRLLCDELGCEEPQSCGWPSKSGYRLTCYDHYQKRLER